VEGLLSYFKDTFDELANHHQQQFDVADFFRRLPRMLDQTSLHWWNKQFSPLEVAEVEQISKDIIVNTS
jgi:hypothetical protein